MLVSQHQLEAARFAKNDDGSGDVLSYLRLVPKDHYVEATDGYVLVRVTQTSPIGEEDFPGGTTEPFVSPTDPVLIPASLALTVAKQLAQRPARRALPILGYARVLTDGTVTRIETTDLETTRVSQVKRPDVMWPNTEHVTKATHALKAEPIVLGAAYLTAIARYAATFERCSVTLTCYGAFEPVQWAWDADDHQVRIWLMPLRPPTG